MNSAAYESPAAALLGAGVWLFIKSPGYRDRVVGELEWRLAAPIRFNQCQVFWHNRMPYAWVSWA